MKRLFFDLTAAAVHGADHGVKTQTLNAQASVSLRNHFFLVVEKVKNVFKCCFLTCVLLIKQTNCGSTLHM